MKTQKPLSALQEKSLLRFTESNNMLIGFKGHGVSKNMAHVSYFVLNSLVKRGLASYKESVDTHSPALVRTIWTLTEQGKDVAYTLRTAQ